MGVVVPAKEQINNFARKWEKSGLETIVTAATPYGPTVREECFKAAEIMKKHNVKLIVMDCPGYTMEAKKIVQEVTGKPVVLVRTAIAAMIKQLVG